MGNDQLYEQLSCPAPRVTVKKGLECNSIRDSRHTVINHGSDAQNANLQFYLLLIKENLKEIIQ